MAIQLKTPIPGPKGQALMADRQKHVARGPFHATPIFVSRAKGALIEDVDGNTFIDFASGIGVTNVGHLAAPVVEAVQSQANKFMHVSFNVTPYESYVRLAEKLNRAAPGTHAKKSFIANTGAEAVENAIKIARAHTGRQAVICFDHAFHGRTYMAMALTSKVKPYRYGFAPFPSEVYRAPFPYAYRWPTGSDVEKVSKECFEQFEDLVNNRVGPTQTAAVIIEPILGEGGFVAAPASFLKRLREYCTTHGIVLIADEIQTGFGRTGTLFACEQLGLVPDLITTAKGLGGGMPISAVTGRAEMMDAPIEGGVGGTFNGNPLACEAALAVFRMFEQGDALAQARAVGEHLSARLSSWKTQFPVIGDHRGLGPMRAIEFTNTELAKKLAKYCYERGVIVMTAGTYGNVIRFLVPVTIERELLDEGLDVIEAGLKDLKETTK